jgi:hypothetical protein
MPNANQDNGFKGFTSIQVIIFPDAWIEPEQMAAVRAWSIAWRT